MLLTPVDRVEIMVLMDNVTDYLMEDSEHVKRPPLSKDGQPHLKPLLAEHGLSLLVRIHGENKKQTVLLDTAWSAAGLAHNMDYLGIDPDEIDVIVLSHGHADHSGGLPWLLDQISSPITVVAHPDAFVTDRYLEWEEKFSLIQPDKQNIIESGGQVVETKEPYLSPDNVWAATGQIPRVTEFERGLPNAYIDRDGLKETDHIQDDQSIVISIKNRGLVLISGCAHSGIINTIKYAQKLTGINHIYAVIGGFHLAGPIFEQALDKTIEALRNIDPEIIIPMHCTGFMSSARIMKEFPTQHIAGCVGSKISLRAQ